jgi:hypothetical protein
LGQSAPINPAKDVLPSDPQPVDLGSANEGLIAMLEILSAVLANGQACDNWLAARPANLERARASIRLMLRDGEALAASMARLQALLAESAGAPARPGHPSSCSLPERAE